MVSTTLSDYFSSSQSSICATLENEDGGASFIQDEWKRPTGGGGLSCVLENGAVFEKAGVNISKIEGVVDSDQERHLFSQLCAQQQRDSFVCDQARYLATGISLVIHPKNPYIPTVHMNYRYFELCQGDDSLWWFGGGSDLTPYVLNMDDANHFHRSLKTACDLLSPEYYPRFKRACDQYFYLPHRQEHRGVGGIFFDYLHERKPDHYTQLAHACCDAFLPSYLPLVQEHKDDDYTEELRDWQLYRRGRYVEFNLIHDRGTLFGLKSNGRIESIFMSLPPQVSWVYDESRLTQDHQDLLTIIKTPRDWV